MAKKKIAKKSSAKVKSATPVATLPENSFQPKNRKAWQTWLAKNYQRPLGVWLITLKKSAASSKSEAFITYDESVEDALCVGWVDSIRRKVDDERSMLYFAPRKPKSGWSRLNKTRIEKLQAAGLMQPAGQAKIDAAIADGSWTKLDAVEDLVLEGDLLDALRSYPKALANFEAFPRSAKRGVLEWVAQAKRAETRAKRIEEIARLAAENRRANQWYSDSKKNT